MSRSKELFERARRVTPGGVHSPVRALAGVGRPPVFMQSANGANLTDADGRQYIDFCMSFGPLILGHRHPAVHAAITAALEHGWSFGTAEPGSLALAELVTDNIAFVESVRFMNSGTEAVMTALRLARAATGRQRILKFAGCYHGHSDAMLIRAGSGLAGQAQPDSAGVTDAVAGETLVAPLDNDEALDAIFATHGAQLAAAIIEPVPANYGLLPQRHVFLEKLARHCRAHGSLLIFDEVITGFRAGFGGFSEASGIAPDLVTWGKIIGGGFPVGAVAGPRDLMNRLAPAGPVYQAGTLSANPVAMAAGFATLEALLDGTIYTQLESLGRQLDTALAGHASLALQRYDSIFWLIPAQLPRDSMPRSPDQLPEGLGERYAPLFAKALNGGVYLPPSPWEVGFLSAAHTPADIRHLAEVL